MGDRWRVVGNGDLTPKNNRGSFLVALVGMTLREGKCI